MNDKQTELTGSSGQIRPKYLLQKCPVCNGWGTVSFKRIKCHACLGKGYITVPAEKERERYGNQGT